MSKIYCSYDTKDLATKQCENCPVLLCSSCGYTDESGDYCNECWMVHQEEDLGKCASCGMDLQPIYENNGYSEPAGPSKWEISGYEPCRECKGGNHE